MNNKSNNENKEYLKPKEKPLRKYKPIILNILIIILVILIGMLIVNLNQKDTNPHNITQKQLQCLENQYKFYGAVWCKHCNNQKKDLGSFISDRVFIDCDKNKLECRDLIIKAYPTNIMINKDTSKIVRIEGELGFEKIIEYTGC